MEATDFVRDVDTWVGRYDRIGDTTTLDRKTLKNELKKFGADFSNLTVEDHQSLRKFQNVDSKIGVLKVLGTEKYNEYKSFCLHWAEDFEADKNNRPLPKLKNINKDRKKAASESKISGMLHYLHFMVSYASKDLTTKNISEYLIAMDTNGQLWQERGFDDTRTKIQVDGKMIRMGSLPPSFAKDAWEFMKTWKK